MYQSKYSTRGPHCRLHSSTSLCLLDVLTQSCHSNSCVCLWNDTLFIYYAYSSISCVVVLIHIAVQGSSSRKGLCTLYWLRACHTWLLVFGLLVFFCSYNTRRGNRTYDTKFEKYPPKRGTCLKATNRTSIRKYEATQVVSCVDCVALSYIEGHHVPQYNKHT